MKYSSIDCCRFILACCIVTLHNPYGNYTWVNAVFRVAVPLFFMFSGFFCVYGDKETTMLKSKATAIRITKLALSANGLFLIWGIISNRFNVVGYLRTVFSINNIIKSVLFNFTPLKAHLWFLSALVLCYVMVYMDTKFELGRKLHVIILILFIIYTLCEFDNIIIGRNINNVYYRNFWFMGAFYFELGRGISKNKEQFKINLPIAIKMLLCLMAFTIIIFEIRWVGIKDTYILGLFPTLVIFEMLIKNPKAGEGRVLEKLGKKYSLFIYIVHPIVLDVVWMIFYKWNVPKIPGMIVIIPLVVVITLGIGGVYKKN